MTDPVPYCDPLGGEGTTNGIMNIIIFILIKNIDPGLGMVMFYCNLRGLDTRIEMRCFSGVYVSDLGVTSLIKITILSGF